MKNKNLYKLQILLLLIIVSFIAAYPQSKIKNVDPSIKKMVLIPSGYFIPLFKGNVDSEKIKVNKFYLDKYPVTNREFLDFVKQNPKWQKSKVKKIFAEDSYLKDWKGDLKLGSLAQPKSPVTNVSWFAAQEYAKWIGKRLPTISEWEYTASAGWKIFNGNKEKDFKEQILNWYSKPIDGKIHSVGESKPNYFGVYDLHGLIWEWVDDFNSILVTGESRGDIGLERNLFCGSGSLKSADPSDYAAFMRYAFRSSLKAYYTVANLGFRCAKDIIPNNITRK